MHGEFHPKSNSLRLSTKGKKESQGLVSVRTTVQDETANTYEYMRKMAPADPRNNTGDLYPEEHRPRNS